MSKKTKNTPQVSDNTEVIARLEAEFAEVADRFEKLHAFLGHGEKSVKKVGEEQMSLMIDQHDAMETYRNILAVRIALLKRKV